LFRKIQEDALRTHLFANGGYYSTIYLKDLCDMFDLSEKKVQKLVARMIFEEGLQASLDQPRNLLVMRRVIPTPLQSLALALAEKVNQLTEDNERALDAKLGSEHLGSRDSQRRDQRGAGARDRGAGRNAGRANQRNRVQQNRA
jgi:translation initiation factor 3 subunit C